MFVPYTSALGLPVWSPTLGLNVSRPCWVGVLEKKCVSVDTTRARNSHLQLIQVNVKYWRQTTLLIVSEMLKPPRTRFFLAWPIDVAKKKNRVRSILERDAWGAQANRSDQVSDCTYQQQNNACAWMPVILPLLVSFVIRIINQNITAGRGKKRTHSKATIITTTRNDILYEILSKDTLSYFTLSDISKEWQHARSMKHSKMW